MVTASPGRLLRRAGPVAPAALALLLVLGLAPRSAEAQQPAPPPHQQVISANPFGLLLEFFNAEYERIVTRSSTAGIGGSTYSSDDDRYLNMDAFWRFYPSGDPLDGWAFGAKAGLTSVSDADTYFGFGFDVNRSWLLGADQNFYVGIGFGLKRLLGASELDDAPAFIPTIRLVNVGFAF
jgi:hypothetical protein